MGYVCAICSMTRIVCRWVGDRQNERILHDLAGVRDELRVHGAMIMRLEGAVASLSEQVHVMHNQTGRMNDRLGKLEDAQP
jgi:hypothetical protein